MSTSDRNPLIGSSASDTMDQCADVLSYLSFYNRSEKGVIDPNDDVRCGQLLIYRTLIHALRFEIERN